MLFRSLGGEGVVTHLREVAQGLACEGLEGVGSGGEPLHSLPNGADGLVDPLDEGPEFGAERLEGVDPVDSNACGGLEVLESRLVGLRPFGLLGDGGLAAAASVRDCSP